MQNSNIFSKSLLLTYFNLKTTLSLLYISTSRLHNNINMRVIVVYTLLDVCGLQVFCYGNYLRECIVNFGFREFCAREH